MKLKRPALPNLLPWGEGGAQRSWEDEGLGTSPTGTPSKRPYSVPSLNPHPPTASRRAPPSPAGRGVLATAAIVFARIATPTLAQDRAPAPRQTLTDLAYVLGQSHALRQACLGPLDQFWRGRMMKMVEAEAPDPAFTTRLHNAFNSGFSSAQAQYPACGADSRRAEAAAAARGQALASSLAKEMADDQTAR